MHYQWVTLRVGIFEQLFCIDNFLQDIFSKTYTFLGMDREVRVTSRFSWLFELSETLNSGLPGTALKSRPVFCFKYQGLIMNKEIFNGFPQYIRITICAQIKKLLSTPYFGYDDREDIAQDMLCHYLYKFYEIPDVDEALVVHDLRQYALHLLDKRKRTRVHLTSSLDSDQSDGDFFCANLSTSTDNVRMLMAYEFLERADTPKLKNAMRLIMEGESIDSVSRTLHISKETIYKFFKRMREL